MAVFTKVRRTGRRNVGRFVLLLLLLFLITKKYIFKSQIISDIDILKYAVTEKSKYIYVKKKKNRNFKNGTLQKNCLNNLTYTSVHY